MWGNVHYGLLFWWNVCKLDILHIQKMQVANCVETRKKVHSNTKYRDTKEFLKIDLSEFEAVSSRLKRGLCNPGPFCERGGSLL